MESGSTDKDYYLNIGIAKDLKNKEERFLYRLFEIFPGFVSWAILFLFVFLSWQAPLWVAVFNIAFVIFWILRVFYFSFFTWFSYKKMKINEKEDWLGKLSSLRELPSPFLGEARTWKDIYHLIIVPMCGEPLDVARESFKCLKAADYPKDKMIVVLGCEEGAKDTALLVSKEIEKEFGATFFKFLVTWHPTHLPGEMPGKGSNETWAAKEAKKMIDQLKIPYENIIFSSLDVDTCIFPKYFSCLTYKYLTSAKPTRTSFQPVPLYVNNVWQAPVMSRIFSFSSTFWHALNQERPEKLITFSSHSMSFDALAGVGFKQTNVVSDDSRIFWQCFFKYDGDYRAEPMHYPVSMDVNSAGGFWKTLFNIYKQQRRWAYGVGDIPYVLFGFLKNRRISFKKKWSLGFELIEGHITWAVASLIIIFSGWLPLFLGASRMKDTLMSYNLPKVISGIMNFSMVGLISSAFLSYLILQSGPSRKRLSEYLGFAIGWLCFPVMMLFFASLPALDAQTRWLLGRYMGFWVTEKFRK